MKRNFWRKTAAFTLALTLATGSLPANTPLQDLFSGAVLTAHAEVTASGYCGASTNEGGAESVVWSLEGGVLTISGTGEMEDFYDDVPPWYSSRSDITEAVIESGVTSIGKRAFINCSSITSVTIPDSVTTIGMAAFYGCKSLTSVTIPDSVTSIGEGAFSQCSAFTSITIPDSVTNIGALALNSCYSLTSVIMESETPPVIGDNIFNNTPEDIIIRVPANAVDDYQTDEKWSAYKERITTMNIVALGYCGASSNEGGETSVSWTLNTDGVLTISGTGSMKNSDSASAPWKDYKSDIIEVVIENGVTSIGKYAFYSSNLTSVTIPDSVGSIGEYAFGECRSLTSVIIPDGVTSIGKYAFRGCSSLSSVTIPDSVTTIGVFTFYGCSSLTSVIIPDGVTSIGSRAFDGCTSLTSVTIPDGVTSIGSQAFVGCTSLTSVTIPDSVTSLGFAAFSDCTSLKSVIVERAETLTALGIGSFHCWDDEVGCNVILPNVTIYVPATKAEEYKNAENWSDYADRIIGYSDTQLPDGKYKQTAEKNGTYYTRFVFVVPRTDFAGKSKALFTATYNGTDYTDETSTYYTGVISNGVTYNPASSSDRAMFVVTVSSGSDISDDLTCKLDFG